MLCGYKLAKYKRKRHMHHIIDMQNPSVKQKQKRLQKKPRAEPCIRFLEISWIKNSLRFRFDVGKNGGSKVHSLAELRACVGMSWKCGSVIANPGRESSR